MAKISADCKIEHHAMMFAFLAKHAIELCGEAGKEAILPLKGFYDQLENILSACLNMTAMEKYLAIIADNSSKGIYLEDGTLVGHLLPDIDGGLGKSQKLQRRLSL